MSAADESAYNFVVDQKEKLVVVAVAIGALGPAAVLNGTILIRQCEDNDTPVCSGLQPEQHHIDNREPEHSILGARVAAVTSATPSPTGDIIVNLTGQRATFTTGNLSGLGASITSGAGDLRGERLSDSGTTDFLVTEQGDYLLSEQGDRIAMEQQLPSGAQATDSAPVARTGIQIDRAPNLLMSTLKPSA